MKNLLWVILLFGCFNSYGQNGLSPSTAFTNLGHVNDASFPAGTYFFNINGTAFTSYVDDSGWVLLASGEAQNTTTYPETKTMSLQSNGILPVAVFSNKLEIVNNVKSQFRYETSSYHIRASLATFLFSVGWVHEHHPHLHPLESWKQTIILVELPICCS